MKNTRRYFLCALIAPLLFFIFVLGPKVFAASEGIINKTTSNLVTIEDIPDQGYTGAGVEPDVVLKDGDHLLKKGQDYYVEFENNIQKSTSGAKVKITGIVSYSGTADAYFSIVDMLDLKDAEIKLYTDSSMENELVNPVYTGSDIIPYEVVKLGNKTLERGTDYTVSYEYNRDITTSPKWARVIVTAASGSIYTGTSKPENESAEEQLKGFGHGKFAIIPREASLDQDLEVNTLTYNGSDQQLIKTACSSSGADYFNYGVLDSASGKPDASTTDITNDIVKKKDAGKYYIYVYLKALDGYASQTFYREVNIAKKTPVLTAPVAKSGLVYSHSGQELIETAAVKDSEDTANELKIQYAVSSSNTSAPQTGWTESLSGITATDAGTYYVWYKTESTDNFNEFNSTSGVKVEIAKYQPTFKDSYSGTSKDYTGSEIDMDEADDYINFAGTDSYDENTHGTITYTYEKSVSGTYESMSGAKPILVNDEKPYRVTVSLSGSTNYEPVTKQVNLTVLRIDPSMSGLNYVSSDLTYNGSEQSLVVSYTPNNETKLQYSLSTSSASAGDSWSGVAQKAKDAGTYYIWYKADQTANYKSISGTCLGSTSGKTINKYTPTISVSGKTVTYNGTETNYTESDVEVTLVASETYSGTNWPLTFGYYSESGCSGEEVSSHSGAGTYYVKASLSSSGNYNSASGIGTLVVDKANSEYDTTPSGKTLTYDSTEQELINEGSSSGGTVKYYLGDAEPSSSGDWQESASGLTKKNAGTYTFWYKIFGDPNHYDKDSSSGSTTINALNIDKDKVSVSGVKDETYTGSAITHNITVSYSGHGTVSEDDYSVSYSGNIDAGTASYNISFSGNYTGSKSGTFTINKINSEYSTSVSGKSNLTYNKQAQELINAGSTSGGTIHYHLGATASASAGDWTTSASGIKETNAGTYTYWHKIIGDNNHNDLAAASGTVTISPFEVTSENASISGVVDKSYSGTAITQDISISCSGIGDVPESDYVVTYSNNISAGTASYSISFSGNYSGSLSGTFKINGTDPTVTAPEANTLTYNGANQQLVQAGSASGGTIEYFLSSISGSSSGTYTTDVTSMSGKDAGTYYVWYQVKGTKPQYNDLDPECITVTISKCSYNDTNFAISSISGETYTGSAITPEPVITFDNKVSGSGSYSGTLIKDSDYILNYESNVNASTSGKVTISFSGSFSGSTYRYFTINPKDISSCSGSLSETSYDETGEEIKPTTTVKDGTTTLTKDTHYTLSYSGNLKNSTSGASVTVTGIGNYTGTQVLPFTINKNNVTVTQDNNGNLIISCSNNKYINALLKTFNDNVGNPKVTVSFGSTADKIEIVENKTDNKTKIVKDGNNIKIPYSVIRTKNNLIDKFNPSTSTTPNKFDVTINIKDFSTASCSGINTTRGIEYIDLTTQSALASPDNANSTFYLDGVELTNAQAKKVAIIDNATRIVQTYQFADSSSGTDIHKKYPTSFNVYRIIQSVNTQTGISSAKFEHLEDLDDIMVYAGTSIRVTTGKTNGIRIITSIPMDKRTAMISNNSSGVEGYKIVEYGTVVGWDKSASASGRIDPTMVYNKQKNDFESDSNCFGHGRAYDIKDSYNKIFKTDNTNKIIQFTNVIVEGTAANEKWTGKLNNDFALRSYMIIRPVGATDASQDVVLYGGTLHRSIYYVAKVNQNTFTANTAPDIYIENIIKQVENPQ